MVFSTDSVSDVKNLNTVFSRSTIFQGSGENDRQMRGNDKWGKPLFNRKSCTLSFASWQNFASIENTTFQDLKCVHGPRQLHCAHIRQP
jgi:hypothetical protein